MTEASLTKLRVGARLVSLSQEKEGIMMDLPEVARLHIREHSPLPDILQVVCDVVHHLLPWL